MSAKLNWPPDAAVFEGSDVEPVVYHSDALDELLVRAESWVTAADSLRNNIQLMAKAEKECAQRIRKIAVGVSLPVEFAVPQRPTDESGAKVKDSLRTTAAHCFQELPAQLATKHEEIAKSLLALDNGKAKEAQKLAKKHRSMVDSTVTSLCESVAEKRDELREKAKNLHNVEGGVGGDQDVWLLRVQAAAARRKERETSGAFCEKVSKLWGEVQQFESEITNKMGEVMTAFLATQTNTLAAADAFIQTQARAVRTLDSAADFQLFASHPRVVPSITAPSADWRTWKGAGTQEALEDETRGGVMACGEDSEVVCMGELQRQGTMIKFNWHRHFFVLTSNAFLHYFPSKDDPTPDASYALPNYKVEAVIENHILTVTLLPKAKSWFASSSPIKIILKQAEEGGAALEQWARALNGLAAPRPSE